MGWFGLHFRAQREKPSILIRLKLKNSKIRKNDPPGAHGPPGLGRGWPHNPPLGPMGPHGSFMVAPLFNDEAAKSRYGAQWAPRGPPKSRARRQNCFFFGSPPPRDPPPGPPLPPLPRAPFPNAPLSLACSHAGAADSKQMRKARLTRRLRYASCNLF